MQVRQNINRIKISETDKETKKMKYKKAINKSKKIQNKTGVGTKSQNLFKTALEETFKIKKKEMKFEELMNKEEKYKKKLEKKLEKRKGH